MGRKPKIPKKEDSASQQHSPTIQKVIQKKINSSNLTFYHVQFKDPTGKSCTDWISENQLESYPEFHQQRDIFNSQQIKMENSKKSNTKKSQTKVSKKQTQNTEIKSKKITPSKQSNQNKFNININKQSSLDSFVKKTTSNQIEQQKPSNDKRLQPLIAKSIELIKNKLSESKKLQKSKEKQVKKQTQSVWMDKIKSIREIKGYQMVDNEIFYHVDVYDKNGQTIFVPPLSSETVSELDRVRLGMFLQQSLLRGIEQQRGTKSSRR